MCKGAFRKEAVKVNFFFLVYINDLVVDIDCNIKLLADDPSICKTFYNPFIFAALPNTDLEKKPMTSLKNGLFPLTHLNRMYDHF